MLSLGGHRLEDATLAGYAYGPPLGTAPTYVIVGGITAQPFPFGDGRSAGWWPALAAHDLVDVTRHTVLCPAWPANGTTWAGLDPTGSRPLPTLTVADLADLLLAWLDGLGCVQPVRFLGASLGGLVGLHLAVREPRRIAQLVSISAGLRPDGWGTATRHLQRELVRDGLRSGDVATGMLRARQLGMLTYRGREELDTRFGTLLPGLDRPPVASYLDHHGKRFAETFPVATFLMLSEAIDRCALAELPAGVRHSLARIRCPVAVVGIPGDMLFPWTLQAEMHRELQAAGAQSSLWRLDSVFGHDAFLADQDRLADVLRDTGFFGEGAAVAGTTETPTPLPATSPLKRIRIGLIGCGVVGQGVLELLHRQSAALANRYGVRIEVTHIAVRDPERDRGPHAHGIPKTTDPMSLVGHPEVDVLVEVAGGLVPFEAVLKAALAAGIPVVTANKALLARKLGELAALAARTGTPLLCEASAAAALPIIRHLSHRADEIERLAGIVNGTNNYLLTRLAQDETPMADAIAEAQALGLAEADPSADIDGHDAAAKLSILAYRAFGLWFSPTDFPVRGIADITPVDCDLAEAMGFRIRHLARAARVGETLDLGVEPMLLRDWHLLANVEEEYNAVYLVCASAGDLSFFGKGAGALPTATAVVGDLIDLAQDHGARWPAPRRVPRADDTHIARRRYLRVSVQLHPTQARRVESHLRRNHLTVENRAARVDGEHVHLGFLVGACTGGALAEVVDRLRKLGRVEQVLTLSVEE